MNILVTINGLYIEPNFDEIQQALDAYASGDVVPIPDPEMVEASRKAMENGKSLTSEELLTKLEKKRNSEFERLNELLSEVKEKNNGPE
jgi:isopropylmalate/homocitrate/citramalate synthase